MHELSEAMIHTKKTRAPCHDIPSIYNQRHQHDQSDREFAYLWVMLIEFLNNFAYLLKIRGQTKERIKLMEKGSLDFFNVASVNIKGKSISLYTTTAFVTY